ncbi:unnamed protein product [Closterium sp. NIES-64]|nr:unnamed protein product [Closterium sp. NIES-65]CAI6002806.1 unnamed protein product [Closterium sp. NIES-64]
MTQAKEVVTAALEAGWGTVVVDGAAEEGESGAGKKGKRKGGKDGEEISPPVAARQNWVARGDAERRGGGERLAAWVRVASAAEQEVMCALAWREDAVVMDAADWKMTDPLASQSGNQRTQQRHLYRPCHRQPNLPEGPSLAPLPVPRCLLYPPPPRPLVASPWKPRLSRE